MNANPEVQLASLLVIKKDYIKDRNQIQDDYWKKHLPPGERAAGVKNIPPPNVRKVDDVQRQYQWRIEFDNLLYVVDVTVHNSDGTMVSSSCCYDGETEIDNMVLEFWLTFTAARCDLTM